MFTTEANGLCLQNKRDKYSPYTTTGFTITMYSRCITILRAITETQTATVVETTGRYVCTHLWLLLWCCCAIRQTEADRVSGGTRCVGCLVLGVVNGNQTGG